MSKFLNDIKKNLKIGIEKTEEIGKIGKIKVDILGIQHSLDKAFRELGEIAYSFLKDSKKGDLKTDKKAGDLLKKIDQYQSDIKAKEKEIQALKKEFNDSKKNSAKSNDSAKSNPKSTGAGDEKTGSSEESPKVKPAVRKPAAKPKAKAAVKKPAAKSTQAKSKSSTKTTKVS